MLFQADSLFYTSILRYKKKTLVWNEIRTQKLKIIPGSSLKKKVILRKCPHIYLPGIS